MKCFVGIDPGKKGAIAIVNENSQLVNLVKMPESVSEIYSMLSYYKKSIDVIAIEKAQAMNRTGQSQGAASMFSYGLGYGKLLGCLEILGCRYEEARPMQWMRLMYGDFPKGTSKAQGKKLCAAMHPDESFIPARCRVIHDGLTDATVIAHYARRFLQS